MTKDRVNEIDFLRFFAAILVVFFHYAFRGSAADGLSPLTYPALAPFAKYGYLGVELFFMISGFVILMTASSGSLRGFIVSRIVRLYPAFWACCALTYIVTISCGLPQFRANFSQFAINLTMLSGFFGVPSIDNAYWSLFVEMRFYFLVGLVLLLGRIHQVEFFLVLWIISTIANAFIHSGKIEFLLITNYSPFFIAGASFFLIWSRGVSATRLTLLALAWLLGVNEALKSLPSFAQHYSVELSQLVVIGIVSSFFGIMWLISLRKTGSFGYKRWVNLGVVTYPLYLLHQNIGYIAFNIGHNVLSPHLLMWGIFVLMIFTSYGVHRMMEGTFAQALKRCINACMDTVSFSKSPR